MGVKSGENPIVRLARLATMAVLFAVLATTTVQAQTPTTPAVLINPVTAAEASDIVNGRVIDVAFADLADGTIRTEYTLEIDEAVVGGLSGTVIVVDNGGISPTTGAIQVMTHGPSFVLDRPVQVALTTNAPWLGFDLPAGSYAVAGLYLGVVDLPLTEPFDADAPLLGATSANLTAGGGYSLLQVTFATQPPVTVPIEPWTDTGTYFVNPAGNNFGAGVIGTIAGAIADWADEPLSDVPRATYGGTSTANTPNGTLGNARGFNLVDFVALPAGINGRGGSFYASVGNPIQAGRPIEWTIQLSTVTNWTRFDLGSTVRHEFGHVLGFAHVADSSELMTSLVVSTPGQPPQVFGMTPGAVAGAVSFYGATPPPPSTCTPVGNGGGGTGSVASTPSTYVALTPERLLDTRTATQVGQYATCLLYTSPSPRDATLSRMPSSA